MNPYAELISKEEAKLELLRKKVSACEQLIAALRGTDADDIDVAIAKQMGQSTPTVINATPGQIPSVSGMRMRKDSAAPLVLQYLGKDGKTLDEIESHMASIGRPVSRASLRTMLMNLRKVNKFIDSPKMGFYKLSDAGATAIGLDLI
jgi:hypothetical protein